MPQKASFAAATIVSFIVGLIAGAVITVYLPSANPAPNPKTQAPPENSIFTTQIATIEGSVTKTDGSKLTIKNTKGQEGEFQASVNLTVFKKDNPGQPVPNAFEGVGTIETGREGRVVLELKDESYQVTSIIYSKPLQNTAKPSTPSSAPRK